MAINTMSASATIKWIPFVYRRDIDPKVSLFELDGLPTFTMNAICSSFLLSIFVSLTILVSMLDTLVIFELVSS